ncbi:MAG: hypothetical protein OTI34_14325 [Lewinella sp.]|jgi:hypothetical protein|nr:hypothetical protein [Lewinella sp.]
MVAEKTFLDTFMNFLVTNPSSQEIIDFKASRAQAHRLEYLISKSKIEDLTLEEQMEVQATFQANHYVAMFKIRAYSELKVRA